jgi:hypothetical protein
VILLQQVDPDSARADVRRILDDRRYRSDPAPRPFRGPLRWFGDRLATIEHWIGDVLRFVPRFVWLGAGLLAVGLLAAWIMRRVQRSSTRAGASVAGARGAAREDPVALEREAEVAEQRGDLERAVRLRFRAGLLRLGNRGVIEYQPSLTTSEVRTLLGSDSFDDLAGTFEAIAYGGRRAVPPDVAAARTNWPKVVEQGRRR